MEMPREGDYIAIQSYKHNGTLHRNWRDTMVVKTEQNIIIGVNDRTLITEEDGRKWISREPAIVYFHRKLWFNVIAMLRPDGVAYYANLASPFILDREALKYIDYDLDIKVFPDGEKRLLDADEYAMNKKRWHYSEEIDSILRSTSFELLDWIDQKKGPFARKFVQIWYERYNQLRPDLDRSFLRRENEERKNTRHITLSVRFLCQIKLTKIRHIQLLFKRWKMILYSKSLSKTMGMKMNEQAWWYLDQKTFMFWYGILADDKQMPVAGLNKFELPASEIAEINTPDSNLAFFSQPLNFVIPTF